MIFVIMKLYRVQYILSGCMSTGSYQWELLQVKKIHNTKVTGLGKILNIQFVRKKWNLVNVLYLLQN